MAIESANSELYTDAVVLLGAAVVAAPIFRFIGLGTVLGYLFAGVLIGPVFGFFYSSESESILHFAELGIVFLLFIVGLEMKPSRLWSMRKDILGLGTAQVIACGIVLSALGWFVAPNWNMAVVAGFGLALSSTAFALQLLETRKEMNTVHGRKTFSILLYQDLAIIPLLTVVPLLSSYTESGASWSSFFIAVGAIAFVVLAGRTLINPFLGLIARTGANEAMIAAALFVVFGAAMLMQAAGLSMALGSFLAGVLLAESSYRVELEANIEPFRGILLGLFFMAVGLSLDLDRLASQWHLVVIYVLTAMVVKALIIYWSCRFFQTDHKESVRTAALLSQHGEFGFVLFAAATSVSILGPVTSSLLIAMVVLSMALTPLSLFVGELVLRFQNDDDEGMEEDFAGVSEDAPVLMIGFSRMGQVVSQALLASGTDVTVIDNNPNTIRQAGRFGFRIYFGNGARKDVLLAAGIKKARLVAICTHTPEVTNRIIDLVSTEFPDKIIYARSYDRRHTIDLMDKPVKFHIRETFESALVFGAEMLQGLGFTREEAEEITIEVRKLDRERLYKQHREGLSAGLDLLHRKPKIQPEPLLEPTHGPEALDERSKELVEADAQDDLKTQKSEAAE